MKFDLIDFDRRIAAYFLMILLIVSVIMVSCDRKSKNTSPPGQEVGIVTLEPQPVNLKNDLPGRTKAILTSEVRPQIDGIILSRLFEEGATVKAGQTLYQVDPLTYQAAYDKAKASLSNAKANVTSTKLKDQRYAELVKEQGVSKQDADDAHAAYLVAVATVDEMKAALDAAKINLGYTKIKAPISGRISISAVTPGALVTASQTTVLSTIRALDPIYVDFTQSSAELLKLRKTLERSGIEAGNAKVHLKLEDGSSYDQIGTLKLQEVSVDESTGSVTLRAEFPNSKEILLPGMYVRAIVEEAVDSTAILAPQRGIARNPAGEATALVVGAKDQVELRKVTVDRAIDDTWLVTSGLSGGDRLIVDGLNKIKIGQTVIPVAADKPDTTRKPDPSKKGGD